MVVLLLSLASAVGTAAYGVTHAVDPARPIPAGAAGAPSTSANGSTEPTRTTPSSTRPTASAKTDRTDTTRTTDQKVTIPSDAPAKYRRNDVTARPGGSAGRVITFDVRVQAGLPYDADDVAEAIADTLADPRSWRADGRQRFRLVSDPAKAELHAYLVTPDTTDRLCAPLLTRGEVSCQQGRAVVLNARRWAYGVRDFDGQVGLYRQYLVNHEFGHYLGYGHVECPANGRRAPVMMQQTKGLDGCKTNAWPYPNR